MVGGNFAGPRCRDNNNIFHSKVEALWEPALGDDVISESCCGEAQSPARDFFQWGKKSKRIRSSMT